MKNDIIKLDAPELINIEQEKSDQIKKTFEPMTEMLASFENDYNSILLESGNGITEEITQKAKRLRINISKVRIQTEKIRLSQKDEYTRAGKAIDGVSNILKWAIIGKEEKLKEIEKYYENQEKIRLDDLQNERVSELSKYVEDAHERQLSTMEDDVWNAYLNSKKKEYEDIRESEKQAEVTRIKKEKDEESERKRIEKENEKLKKEAEEREKIQKKLDDDRIKKERLAQLERDKEEKNRLDVEEKKRIEQEKKLQAEKEEREKIQKKLDEKLQSEKLERQLKKEKEQAEFNKNDSDKIIDLVKDLIDLKTKYVFSSDKNKKSYRKIIEGLDIIINEIEEAVK